MQSGQNLPVSQDAPLEDLSHQVQSPRMAMGFFLSYYGSLHMELRIQEVMLAQGSPGRQEGPV